MASIRREFLIEARPEDVWDAVRDVCALPTRLVLGFVTGIVDLDDKVRRLAWSATGGRLTHHNASMQVFAEGDERTRAVWTADLLPDAMEKPIAAMIEQGCAAMKKALERS
jgi:carbon monoxide dehydrogenase subunit G